VNKKSRPTIFIFIDGLGHTTSKTHNPLFNSDLRTINKLILDESKPIDAIMNVAGLPQSATGQTSLFCGLNAQKIFAGHVQGFPTQAMKKLIAQENIFKKLSDKGITSTFANGYNLTDINNIDRNQRRKISVTTAMTLSTFGTVRLASDLKQGNAVYQDITQEVLVNKGAPLDTISEEEAAHRLIKISATHAFTLFEYFETDIAAHSQDIHRIHKALKKLDNFLNALMTQMDFNTQTLIFCSDHGNIEDNSTSLHTLNPVPLFVRGPFENHFYSSINSLQDIQKSILSYLEPSPI